jgi:hypothetical protein
MRKLSTRPERLRHAQAQLQPVQDFMRRKIGFHLGSLGVIIAR